jgi:hypothetical protein
MEGQNLINVLLLDCCRVFNAENSVIIPGGRSAVSSASVVTSRDLSSSSVKLPSRGLYFIAYGSASGFRAYESDSQGNMTRCLLPLMELPDLPLRDVFDRANDALSKMQHESTMKENQQHLSPHEELQVIWVHMTPGSKMAQRALNAKGDRDFYDAPALNALGPVSLSPAANIIPAAPSHSASSMSADVEVHSNVASSSLSADVPAAHAPSHNI